MKNKLLLTLLALGVSGVAMANSPVPQESVEKPRGKMEQRHKKHVEKMWSYGDKDKDGKISREEALAVANEKFDKADKNKDGFISKEEMEEVRNKMKKAYTRSKDGMKHKEKHVMPDPAPEEVN